MPQKILALLLPLVFLLVSCNQALPPEKETAEIKTNEETEIATEEQTETLSLPTTEIPITTTAHSHVFSIYSICQATCTSAGEYVWICSCGEIKNEYLPVLNHCFSETDCTKPSVCSLCGFQTSAYLGHNYRGGVCTRCQKKIDAPIYVLEKELHFDATRSYVEQLLGTPTEVITEGNFISLIYAESPAELTVIQLDDVGLWGVFTMDSAACFLLDEKTITISDFSGTHDLNSNAYYQDVGSCRVFGFRDNLVSKAFYGLWMRYSECRYDYMNDPKVASSYFGQSRLSWYYINALRAKKGLNPLVWSDAAAKVATDYSVVLAENGVLDHDGSFGQRLTNEGILWRYAGENISEGYFNLYFVCDAYYNSQTHRENIFNESFTHVGMGYYQAALKKNVYGAQIFFCY